jgi:hypothetical protein
MSSVPNLAKLFNEKKTSESKRRCLDNKKSTAKYVYRTSTKNCRKRCGKSFRRRSHKYNCVLKCSNPKARTCKRVVKKEE